MFKKTVPVISDYYQLPNSGLWAYFKHVTKGQPEDYRPPFWGRRDRNEVLQLWQNIVDSLDFESRYPDLYRYEMEMKSKVGPMSIQLPLKDRLESIENYFTMIDNPSEPISDKAIAATIQFFSKIGKIRCKSAEHTVFGNKSSRDKRKKRGMKLSTNSGSWLFTKRKKVTSETLSVLDNLNLNDLSVTTKTGNYTLCATLGWRGQEGGIEVDDVKQRVVWMMPFLLNIKELQYYQPLITAIQDNDLIPAYISMDRVDQEVTYLFDTKPRDQLVICTDFTKFDQHFNKDMQDAAWTVTKSFTGDGFYSIFQAKFNIPLVCNEEVMYSGSHGMGSGSGGTNLDECFAHKTLQFEAAITDNAELNPHSMAYGDDGILTYPGITVEHVIQTYTRHGQEMNATKQYVSTHDCVVLRRWHGMDYRVNGIMVGCYSTFRALGRLLAQERYYDPEKWNANMVVLRALSILENCKWHPYFHEFIDFVITGDKYKLGIDIPGFFDNIETIAKEAIEYFDDFLGYTKSLQEPDSASGVKDWAVVKYLISKMKA